MWVCLDETSLGHGSELWMRGTVVNNESYFYASSQLVTVFLVDMCSDKKHDHSRGHTVPVSLPMVQSTNNVTLHNTSPTFIYAR